jgi:hypothetical protein
MSEETKKTDPIDEEYELKDTDLEQVAGGIVEPVSPINATKKSAIKK